MNTKSLLTRIGVPVLSLGLLGGVAATTAGAASASTVRPYQPPRVAVGSVELASPLQYEQFTVLQGFGPHNLGTVHYTNWTYAEPGSGVWAPKPAADQLAVTYQGTTYHHTLNGASLHLTALSNSRLAFSGTGAYSGGQTWTIKGQITNGRYVRAVISYDAPSTYKMAISGVIQPDGSLSGPADSAGQPGLAFAFAPGSFYSVLSYQAKVQAEHFQGRNNVTFTFTVPASAGLGTHVVVTEKAHDGGRVYRDSLTINGPRYAIIGGPGIIVR